MRRREGTRERRETRSVGGKIWLYEYGSRLWVWRVGNGPVISLPFTSLADPPRPRLRILNRLLRLHPHPTLRSNHDAPGQRVRCVEGDSTRTHAHSHIHASGWMCCSVVILNLFSRYEMYYNFMHSTIVLAAAYYTLCRGIFYGDTFISFDLYQYVYYF